ncbi:MAG: DUF2332 family protein [Rhodobacteraceae bacterium]|nr:DUF2332 family protein [Paracoccaceae bacterium]
MVWPQRIEAAFLKQAKSCRDLGSPFTADLMHLLATRDLPEGIVRDRIQDWPGDPSAAGDALPLRLAGALHRLVLTGEAEKLASLYPPRQNDLDADALYPVLCETLKAHGAFIHDYLDLPPQTNEVRRSSMVMAGLQEIASRTGLGLSLLEVGSSSGLNLCPELYEVSLGGSVFGTPGSSVKLQPDWQGNTPANCELHIESRRGCDQNPLSPSAVEDVLRLKSYTWPDQRDRLDRLENALSICAQAQPVVDRADAADWIAAQLEPKAENVCRVVYHSIVLQYFPEDTKRRFTQSILEAGARASASAPLAWLAIEADGEQPGCRISLTLWPDGSTITLGRADFHGRWIRWDI